MVSRLKADNGWKIQLSNNLYNIIYLKQLYFSSMNFYLNDHQDIIKNVNHNLLFRRNIRIKTSKLPHDFFLPLEGCRYDAAPLLARKVDSNIFHRDIQTPSFESTKFDTICKDSLRYSQRKAESARQSVGKQQDNEQLIQDVIYTTRKLRKASKKHSLDFKNSYSIQMPHKQFRLPKLLSKGLNSIV